MGNQKTIQTRNYNSVGFFCFHSLVFFYKNPTSQTSEKFEDNLNYITAVLERNNVVAKTKRNSFVADDVSITLV